MRMVAYVWYGRIRSAKVGFDGIASVDTGDDDEVDADDADADVDVGADPGIALST